MSSFFQALHDRLAFSSCMTLLVTTRSIRLSVLAILTVFLIILSTIATLVLLGWELNILESVIITLAIGLSVDFSLHYNLASHGDRDRLDIVLYS